MDLLYLDYNCFQRGFDDPSSIRIQMEALACQEIFLQAERGKVRLIWSFMHEDETMLCPFPERQYAALRLSTLCHRRVEPTPEIYKLAQLLQRTGRLSAKDALHLAAAVHSDADAFVTCDDRLINRARRLQIEMRIVNPVDYVRKEMI